MRLLRLYPPPGREISDIYEDLELPPTGCRNAARPYVIINSVSCTSSFSQLAAVEALTGSQSAVDAMVEEFRARRGLVVDGLNAIPGISCRMPAGAFYVFPDVSATGLDGPAFADRLLDATGVCVLSGTAFGRIGSDHIRISYANSRENLAEALERIRDFVGSLR